MKFRYFIAIILLFCFPSSLLALTLDEEKKYGNEVYQQIARSAKLHSDPYVSIYMGIIKNRLEAVADLPLPIKLTVIDSPTMDAFATVGGYVFITTGILEQCDKEEEIAGVLSHEFAHVGRRHVARSLEKEKFINWGTVATMLLGMLVPGAGGSAVMAAGMGAGQAMSLKYTREAEEEADRVGLTTAEKAGYNGLGTAEFLKKLRTTGLEKMVPQYLLTHPYSEDRIMRIERAAAPMKTKVDVSLFPFIVARTAITGKPLGAQNEEIWLNKYRKDPKNQVNIYGAALVYSMKGNTNQAVSVLQTMNSPHKPLFLAEILVKNNQFKEAIDLLSNEAHPIGRFLLAKAYEGQGNLVRAGEVLREVTPYAAAYPEVYHRLGMVLGRQGNEAGGYEYLGRYYFELGKEGPARINLEKAVAKYGINSKEAQDILKLLEKIKGPREEQKNENRRGFTGLPHELLQR
jgi:predicted Zn-dependent protease